MNSGPSFPEGPSLVAAGRMVRHADEIHLGRLRRREDFLVRPLGIVRILRVAVDDSPKIPQFGECFYGDLLRSWETTCEQDDKDGREPHQSMILFCRG